MKLRTVFRKDISGIEDFGAKLLRWSQSFREVVFMDSNMHEDAYGRYEILVGVDAFTSILTDYTRGFEELRQYQRCTQDWIFGYLGYDMKNGLERLQSTNVDGLGFEDLFFFQPKKLFMIKGNQLEAHYLRMCDDEFLEDFEEILCVEADVEESVGLEIRARVLKEEYLSDVSKVISRIQRGDVYEVNYCMEYYSEGKEINAVEKFLDLREVSQAPFSVFLKNKDKYLLCSSPERYLQKSGRKLISQPIKGTAKRVLDAEKDNLEKSRLKNDPKERAENVMITDLVRNDLSRVAKKGSVVVDELCEIYSYKQVHQMVSTISCEMLDDVDVVDAIKFTYPMGSMTGAPKISAMEIIEEMEHHKRGLYSGAVGYFDPESDFDFNVVIRSILYQSQKKYVSYSVGSAITAQSVAENEYEECLLKAKAMHEILTK